MIWNGVISGFLILESPPLLDPFGLPCTASIVVFLSLESFILDEWEPPYFDMERIEDAIGSLVVLCCTLEIALQKLLSRLPKLLLETLVDFWSKDKLFML